MSSKTIKQILSSLSAIVSVETNGNSPGEQQNQNSNECLFGASDALCDCHKSTNEALCKILKSNITVADKVTSETKFQDFDKNSLSGCTCSQEIGEYCAEDIELNYLKTCLLLLNMLKDEIELTETNQTKVEALNPNILGVNDAMTVRKVVEMILGIGICPNLLQGVGLPLKSKQNSLFLKKKRVESRKLLFFVSKLLEILKNQALKGVILPLALNDLIASLIQLGYCPINKTQDNKSSCCCNIKRNVCISCGSLCLHEVEWCRSSLENLLSRSYQPLIVKQLLILQRCTPRGARPKCKWFHRKVGEFLSRCLLKEDGVRSVVQGILDGCETDAMNWERYQSIGKIIAHVPSQVGSVEEYFRIISPQVVKILKMASLKVIDHFSMVAVSCVDSIAINHPALFDKHIFQVLFRPLLQMSEKDITMISLTEETLNEMLAALQKICLSSVSISNQLQYSLARIFQQLFLLYCSLASSVFAERRPLKVLLETLLAKFSPDKTQSVLDCCVFGTTTNGNLEGIGNVDPNLEIHMCLLNDTFTPAQFPTERKVSIVIELFQNKELEKIRGDYFVHLLNTLLIFCQVKDNTEDKKVLLQVDETIDNLKIKIAVVSLISAIMDNFGFTVLQNTPQIVKFIQSILELHITQNHIPDSLEAITYTKETNDSYTVDLVLMLLSTLFGTEKLTQADFDLLKDLIPVLEQISRDHQSASSRALADDLRTYIATRGVVRPKTTQQNAESAESSISFDVNDEGIYKAAMKDLVDPLLPTRGHALITLSKLLRKRNKYALNDEDKLFDIFEANLFSGDTYLYLSAISGLLALVDVHHGKVLPMLCKKFAQVREYGVKKSTMSPEFRMKLCETIVKSCHLCNEFLPQYTDLLLSSLMTGLKDSESFIRASSMSAIGDVCQILKYSIGKIIIEVFSCIKIVLTSDKSNEVRRAGVQVFALLFRGLETRLCETLSNELLDIYRFLKLVKQVDEDELVKSHASNALSILSEIVKNDFLEQPKLEKKIQVLP